MAWLGSSEDSEISGINVTPLVDVVLVLLIIFMITAPAIYQNSLQVQLPKTKSGDGQSKGTLEILVDKEGQIRVDGKSLELSTLEEQVKTSHPTTALILADKKVEHGRVISVLDILKANGVQKFSFGVDRTRASTN